MRNFVKVWCGVGFAMAMVFATPAAYAQDTSLVVVEKDRVEITMIPPKFRIRPARSAVIGFYSWRVDLRTGDGASVVIASDTVMRTDNVRDVVRGSSLRRCPDGRDFSSQRCTTIMVDSIQTLKNDAVRIVIRDSALVAMVRKVRPQEMWASTFEPNGRFRVDHLAVDYEDADPDSKGQLFQHQFAISSRRD